MPTHMLARAAAIGVVASWVALPIQATNAAKQEWDLVGSLPSSLLSGLSSLSLAVSTTGVPHVAFSQFNTGTKVMAYNSTSGSWALVGGLIHEESQGITLALADGTPFLSYTVWTAGAPTIATLVNGSWQTSKPDSRLFPQGAASQFVSMALGSSGSPYIVTSHAVQHASLQTLSSWSTVGPCETRSVYDPSQQKTLEIAECFWTGYCAHDPNAPCHSGRQASMAIDETTGSPHVAIQDCLFKPGSASCLSTKASVLRYNGSSWVFLGGAGFSKGNIADPFLTISSSGTPYVAFSDDSVNGKLTVMRYADGQWVAVGAAGCSSGSASHPWLALHPFDGTPYVSFYDDTIKAVTVLSFRNGTWGTVGDATWAAEKYQASPISFDQMDGTLYSASVPTLTVPISGPVVRKIATPKVATTATTTTMLIASTSNSMTTTSEVDHMTTTTTTTTSGTTERVTSSTVIFTTTMMATTTPTTTPTTTFTSTSTRATFLSTTTATITEPISGTATVAASIFALLLPVVGMV